MVVILLAAAAIFFVLPATLDFLADWLWFGEVGYRQVYSTEITRARRWRGVVSFVVAMAWLDRACAAGAGVDVAGADDASRRAKASRWRCRRAIRCGRSS